jgi:hypothetical protein
MAKPTQATKSAPIPAKAQGQPKAGSWTAKNQTIGLTAGHGELVVHSTSGDPGIKTTDVPDAGGAFILELEVMAAHTGTLKVYAARNGEEFAPGNFVTSEVEDHNQWVVVAVAIPDGGKLTALRINMPGKEGTTRLRNIRLKDVHGMLLKAWSF